MRDNSEAVLVATGALPALILIAAALTLPVCLALLALYRRAVLRSMALASPAAGSAASTCWSCERSAGHSTSGWSASLRSSMTEGRAT